MPDTADAPSLTPREPAPDVATVLRDLAWTVHRRIPEVAGFSPLPTTELAILKHVLDDPGVTVTELARTLGLQQSNTSAAVRTLVERGLVRRRPGATDRRVTLLEATDTARAEHATIAAAWSGAIVAALAELADADVETIARAAPALLALDRVLHHQQARGQLTTPRPGQVDS